MVFDLGESVPGRFDGWSIAAVAKPNEILTDVHNKSKPSKPYFVNLTFWEDRPRLNLWEKKIQDEMKKEALRKKQKKEEEIERETKEKNNLMAISLERSPSKVQYMNGIPLIGKKISREKLAPPILENEAKDIESICFNKARDTLET